MSTLSDEHRKQLLGSAIAPEIMEARGYKTVRNPRALPDMFATYQRTHGLLIPVRNTLGEISTYQLKPDNQRIGKDGKPIKYETAAGGRICLDVPVASRPLIQDAHATLWITEGVKKVDSAVSHGIPCIIGLLGVWIWRGDKVALPDWDEIALKGREVVIAFDSDVMTKDRVRDALDSLSLWLTYRGAIVRYCLLPDLPDGSKCGLDDYLAAGHTRADLEALVVDALPPSESDWQEPIPFDDPTGPDFPSDAMPGTLGRYVASVAASTRTPPGMAAVIALGAVSAAARGRYVVDIPTHDWSEPVVIQSVVFALPGERKSAVVTQVTRPLSLWEQEHRSDDDLRFQEWTSRRRVLEKQLKSAEDAASKGRQPGEPGNSPEDLELIRRAAASELAHHEATIVYPTRIIADDVTPEKAKQMLVEQRGALAVISAEGTFFSILAGRYSDSPSLEVMLNGHAGESITVDRKGAPSLYAPRGCLTIAVACQPHVAEIMGGVDGFQARGGAARILPSFPAPAVGRRSIEPAAIPSHLRDKWEATLRSILDHNPIRDVDSAGFPLPCHLVLSDEAYTQFQRYRAWHEPQLMQGGEFEDLTDWGSKLPGAVLRLAGMLHLASHTRPEDHPITAETIRRAITLGAYFTEHARVMYRVMARRRGHSAARQVLDAIRTLGSLTSRRDLHRKLAARTAFQKATDLDGPLALLKEYGWVRTEEVGKSLLIHLNPLGNPDNADKLGHDDPVMTAPSALSGFPGQQEITGPHESAHQQRVPRISDPVTSWRQVL